MNPVRHRFYLVLRNPALDSVYRWEVVRGYGYHVGLDGWRYIGLFTYRDGHVVFMADERTGLTVTVAATVPRVREATLCLAKCLTPEEYKSIMDEALVKLNAPPRPMEIEILNPHQV